MIILAELKSGDGVLLGILTLVHKDFKTGSNGFFTTGKVVIDGVLYQAQVQLVEIASAAVAQKEKTI